jgi:hypothetical protein
VVRVAASTALGGRTTHPALGGVTASTSLGRIDPQEHAMSPLVLSSATLESVEVPITCDVDPTSDVVEFQLCATGTEPADDTWKTGTWHPTKTTTAVSPLIGAGGVLTPTPGRWQLWVRITDAPEIPVLHSGAIVIT